MQCKDTCFEFVKSLVSRCVERVVVTQVLHRQSFHHLSFAEGSRRVLEINEFLAAVCATEHIRFWKHKGMWNSPLLMFRGDGSTLMTWAIINCGVVCVEQYFLL